MSRRAAWILGAGAALALAVLVALSTPQARDDLATPDDGPNGATDTQLFGPSAPADAPTLTAPQSPSAAPKAEKGPADDGETRAANVVVRSTEGHPIANAQVYWGRWNQIVVLGTTDARGRASVRVPKYATQLSARAERFLPASRRLFWPRRTTHIELLPARHYVRVQLRDAKGPVADARVLFQAQNMAMEAGVSDDAGEARFPVPDFGLFRVKVRQPGFRPFQAGWFPVETSVAEQRVPVRLEPQRPIHGRVADIQGEPVEGARIAVDGTLVAHADANGEFTAPAGAELTVEADGYRPKRFGYDQLQDRLRVRLSPTMPAAAVDALRAKLETELERNCRVIGSDGKPMADVLVQMYGRKVRTDETGRFAAGRAKRWRIAVFKDPWWLTVTGAGPVPDTIHVPPDGRLNGRVLFPEGVGPAACVVSLGPGKGPQIEGPNGGAQRMSYANHPEIEVQRDGRFEFRALAVGRYAMRVMPDPASGLRTKQVEVHVRATNAPLEIVLEQAKETRIQVLAPDGAPVPRAQVRQSVLLSGAPAVDARFTDDAGRVTLRCWNDPTSYVVECVHGRRRASLGPGDHVVRFDPPHRARLTLTRASIPDGTPCEISVRNTANGRALPHKATGTVAGTSVEVLLYKLDPAWEYQVDLKTNEHWSPWADLTFVEGKREATATLEIFREDEDE